MKLFKVCEENIREQTKVYFEYRAKGAKTAIKMAINRKGNPHHSVAELQFCTSRMYGTSGFLGEYLYGCEEIFS